MSAWPKSGTTLDCPVNCPWLVFSANLRYCGCWLAFRMQGVMNDGY